jgi:hypothetical protein
MCESSGLANREYVWGIIESPLSELLSLRLDSGQTLQPLDKKKKKLRWKEVHGDLEQKSGRYTYGFKRGCNRFHTQRTSMPTLLCKVVVSTISIEDISYVTGLRLISSEGLEIGLGYTADRDMPSPNIADQAINMTHLEGFIIALGSRGIQALQLIFDLGQVSPWIGCPDRLLKTRRLANFKSIAALEAGFDVGLFFLTLSSIY